MNLRLALLVVCATGSVQAPAQFVYPKPGDHDHGATLFMQDPFVIKYRQKFFSVFHGDVKTFGQAYAEIQELAKRNPRDARTLVWLGIGHTVKAALLKATKKHAESLILLKKSREVLDRGVSIQPNSPNIYMMRAVSLYIQGQYWPDSELPRSVWEKLRDDCNHMIRSSGAKLLKLSVHSRGEIYGELGIAYLHLGNKAKARATFETILRLDPGTDYAVRARNEIEKLGTPGGS